MPAGWALPACGRIWSTGPLARVWPALATEGVAWQAGFINAAYCGLCFGRQWLVGDAAGLASPLTGEGIFPAVASGEAVAEMIVSRQSMTPALAALIQGQRRHWRILDWSGRNPLLTGMLAEVLLLLLRLQPLLPVALPYKLLYLISAVTLTLTLLPLKLKSATLLPLTTR